MALAYMLGLILTIGFSPGEPSSLNWRLLGVLVALFLFVLGLVRRNAFMCLASVVISAIGAVSTQTVGEFAQTYDVAEPGTVIGLIGLGILMSSILLGRNMPRAMRVTGAVFLMLFTFDFVPETGRTHAVAAAAAIAIISILMWMRTKDPISICVLWIPLACRTWVCMSSTRSWRYVILGFALLAIGAWLSILKGKARYEQISAGVRQGTAT
jgi:hypothetical protein